MYIYSITITDCNFAINKKIKQTGKFLALSIIAVRPYSSLAHSLKTNLIGLDIIFGPERGSRG